MQSVRTPRTRNCRPRTACPPLQRGFQEEGWGSVRQGSRGGALSTPKWGRWGERSFYLIEHLLCAKYHVKFLTRKHLPHKGPEICLFVLCVCVFK